MRRTGFTLVELLTVIVIIGLLAGITTVAVNRAFTGVKSSVVLAEMTQLGMALDNYKNQFGEYPPDNFNDKEAVLRHLRKRWPRFDMDVDTFLEAVYQAYGWDLEKGQYVSPLVFWLGGVPDKTGKPSGFFANPKNPIVDPGTGQREETLFDFAADSIKVESEAPAYVLNDHPVVYFRAFAVGSYLNPAAENDASIDLIPSVQYKDKDTETLSVAVPYAKSSTDEADLSSYTWYDENRFQLIHPGTDGMFSLDTNVDLEKFRVVPSQTNITSADADNVTSFVTSGTLESLYE